jgi:hypothetical protein
LITTFDVPGAGTAAYQGTIVQGINNAGEVVGSYIDANGLWHGFSRTSKGVFTTFDVPGAGTSAGQGTHVYGVSPSGKIVGYFIDSNSVSHGFLGTP